MKVVLHTCSHSTHRRGQRQVPPFDVIPLDHRHSIRASCNVAWASRESKTRDELLALEDCLLRAPRRRISISKFLMPPLLLFHHKRRFRVSSEGFGAQALAETDLDPVLFPPEILVFRTTKHSLLSSSLSQDIR